MFKNFLLSLLFVVAIASGAYAMASVAYVDSEGAVTLVNYNSSGGFTTETVISAGEESLLVPFTHKGQSRLLRSTYSGIEIYDVTNGFSRISNSSFAAVIGTVAEYGDNILLGGFGRGGFIIEFNPATGEVVKEYNYVDSSHENYDSYSSGVTIADGKIYAVFTNNATSEAVYVTMDNNIENITDTLEGHIDWGPAVSKNVLYIGVDSSAGTDLYPKGLYRVNGLTLSKIEGIDNGVNEIVPDGNGGLYYCTSDNFIYHWDGTSSTQIYDTSTLNLTGYLEELAYDVNNSILYAAFFDYYGSQKDNWYALKPDGTGLISETSITTGDDSGLFVVIGNPSEYTSISGNSETSNILPTTEIEAVNSEDLAATTIENLASVISETTKKTIKSTDLQFISKDNIFTYEEPTQSMTERSELPPLIEAGAS